MNTLYYFLLTQSIMVSCVIGVIKYPEMNLSYRPFFYSCLADLVTEVLVFLLIGRHIVPYPISNIYVLISSLILLWQFQLWGIFGPKLVYFRVIAALQAALWVTENFITGNIMNITPFYRIGSSFVIVILAVSTINRHIVQQKGNILKNTQFIICTGLIIFYTYTIFVELLYLSSNGSSYLQNQVFDIKRYINVFTNLLFAFAMLWVPVRKRYTMLY